MLARVKFLASIIFVTTSQGLVAQINKIVVSGIKEGAIDKPVEISRYIDFVTPKLEPIKSETVDTNGKFQFSFTADQTQQYRIQIGSKSNILHLTPGFSYSLIIDKNNEVSTINSTDPTNEIIAKVNKDILNFGQKNNLRKQKSIANVAELDANLEMYVKNSSANRYSINYFKYAMADVYRSYHMRSSHDVDEMRRLEIELLDNSEILVSNSKYFAFIDKYYFWIFNSFRFRRYTPSNEGDAYRSFLQELKFVENDTVQQIAILSASRSAYTSHWGPNRSIVNSIVDSIREVSLHSMIDEIASNLLFKFGKELVGQKAPNFSMMTTESLPVSLSQFEGKYLLLDFWFTGCSPCIEAMPKKKKLRDKYASRLEVISINPVENLDRMKKWVDRHPKYNWPFLSAYRNLEMINYYRIAGYPQYILIGPGGDIAYAPTEFKFEDISDETEKFLKSN